MRLCFVLLFLPSSALAGRRGGSGQRAQQSADKKNVLLLIADDLRPELNKAYGHDYMVTPQLDKLARDSLVFDAAFANFAICAASMSVSLSSSFHIYAHTRSQLLPLRPYARQGTHLELY